MKIKNGDIEIQSNTYYEIIDNHPLIRQEEMEYLQIEEIEYLQIIVYRNGDIVDLQKVFDIKYNKYTFPDYYYWDLAGEYFSTNNVE